MFDLSCFFHVFLCLYEYINATVAREECLGRNRLLCFQPFTVIFIIVFCPDFASVYLRELFQKIDYQDFSNSHLTI